MYFCVHPVAVAAGPAQADHLPVVDDLGARLGEQHGADERAPVRVEARRAVRLEDRDVRTKPGGVPAAGRKAPAPGDADAAVDGNAAPCTRQLRPPSKDAARLAEEVAR
jgi:hypothetical protein